MKYSASRNAVLLRLVTDSFISRGPDISFLSAFPAEREFLFPPLTCLAPTGNVEKIAVGGASWDVVDVKPPLTSPGPTLLSEVVEGSSSVDRYTTNNCALWVVGGARTQACAVHVYSFFAWPG